MSTGPTDRASGDGAAAARPDAGGSAATGPEAEHHAPDRRFERTWMVSLFGTAVGAGILFLPINAGAGGLWPLVVATVLIGPMTYLAHRGLSRFVSASDHPGSDITVVARDLFGEAAGQVITVLYLLSILPIVMIYGIAITNTVDDLLTVQLGLASPSRWLLSGVLVAVLMLVMILGQRIMLVAMQWLVYPLIAILLGISVFLIPHWDFGVFLSAEQSPARMISALILVIPVLIFAFYFAAAVSQFTLAMQRRYQGEADARATVVLRRTTALLVIFTMGFVWSCVLALGVDGLREARDANLPVLSYLAQTLDSPIIAYLGPAVAIAAISSSFFGHYLGAAEGTAGLVRSGVKAMGRTPSEKAVRGSVAVFIFLLTWGAAVADLGVLDMIETLVGPVMALVLYLMPMYAIHRFEALRRFRGLGSNVFVTVAGFFAVGCIVYRVVVVGF
ncbi:HAAAP family serine/threonine permease [Nesterenkonia aerolata]|uniref:HAAAP family serine/threonine permease n=1 Tax=Nesterenkonia aerolata TaxID=3074079 RepID=A0ABU2DTX9_9MICC|nr:HAAAP family serine/threonine permease [Nesterenkonia sp. LY-0111]MDR8019962.1 HAAAP family serine/threonine permease [Nesterenkonia sp. LY-0111]